MAGESSTATSVSTAMATNDTVTSTEAVSSSWSALVWVKIGTRVADSTPPSTSS